MKPKVQTLGGPRCARAPGWRPRQDLHAHPVEDP
jgi:hypothetical protein